MKETKTEFLIARVTKQQKELLQAKATESHISLSELVREILTKFINGPQA